jgi:hypothetical protein
MEATNSTRPSALRCDPIVVTLVHGTFDANAKWTERDSKLCAKLSQELGEDLHFDKFPWSGKNQQRDRESAVAQLADHLTAMSTTFPRSPHFLIGHSHGGNIIRWALGKRDLRTCSIMGVATISTPFIDIKEKNYLFNISTMFRCWKILSTISFALFYLSAAVIYNGITEYIVYPLRVINSGVAVITFMIILSATILLIYIVISKSLDFAKNKLLLSIEKCQRSFFAMHSRSPSLPTPFLCIYTIGDEVRLLFRGANLIVGVWQVVGSIAQITSKFYQRFLSDTVKPAAPFLLFVGSMISLFIMIGNAAGEHASSYIFVEYLLPLTKLAVLLNIGFPLAIGIGVFLYGTPRVLDFLAVDIFSSMRPQGVIPSP